MKPSAYIHTIAVVLIPVTLAQQPDSVTREEDLSRSYSMSFPLRLDFSYLPSYYLHTFCHSSPPPSSCILLSVSLLLTTSY